MTKKDLKNFMIVRNGLDDLYFVFIDETNNFLLRNCSKDEIDDIKRYDKTELPKCHQYMATLDLNDFNEELININKVFLSITEVYDCRIAQLPSVIDIEKIFNVCEPTLLWQRKPSELSKSKMESFKTEDEKLNYISKIVPPYIITE